MVIRKTKSFLHLVKNKELSKQIKWKYYINTNHNHKNTVLISGSGRSGTTWLSQLLNYDNRYRYIFEPFYPEKVEFCSNFKLIQYLKPQERNPNYYEAAERIITGKFRIPFIDRYNKKFLCRKRLIKDVKTNLLLGWLNRNFEHMKIIHIIRHPCAIANSYLKLKWNTNIDVFLSQNDLVEDYLSDFEKEIRKTKDYFEQVIYMWCIENYVPIKQQEKKLLKSKLITYEELCENFENTIKEVYQYIGENYDTEIFETKDIPSYTTRPYAAVLKRTNLLDTWKKELTRQQVKKAESIVSQFDLNNLYEF